MKRQRRTFSTEFKHDAASLVLDQGYSIAEACRSLDVGESALRRWIDQLKAERGGVTPKAKAMTPEQQKIQELELRGSGTKLQRASTIELQMARFKQPERFSFFPLLEAIAAKRAIVNVQNKDQECFKCALPLEPRVDSVA